MASLSEMGGVPGSEADADGEERAVVEAQLLSVEVLVDGHLGYAATNQLSVEGLQDAAKAAYAQAKAASPWQIHPFTPDIRPAVSGQYRSKVVQPFHHFTAGEINDLLARICQGLKVSDKIVQTNASFDNALWGDRPGWSCGANPSSQWSRCPLLPGRLGAHGR